MMYFLYCVLLILLFLGALLADITLVMMLDWQANAFWVLALPIVLLGIAGFKKKYFAGVLAVFVASVAAFFYLITPEEQFKADKWELSCSRMPEIIINGNDAEIRNLRDFKYAPDSDKIVEPNYINQKYDLSKLESMDLYLSHWDGMDNIAHMLLCFNFSDNKTAVLSVEMRCPDGTSRDYHTTFFKQHALIYIWGTKEDLIDLRIHHRVVESLYRYRTTLTPAESRQLFCSLAKRTNQLSKKWEFYQTITGNCTTEVLPFFKEVRSNLKWDIRTLTNGTFDRLLFEQNFLEHRDGEEFESLRARSFITGGRASGKVPAAQKEAEQPAL